VDLIAKKSRPGPTPAPTPSPPPPPTCPFIPAVDCPKLPCYPPKLAGCATSCSCPSCPAVTTCPPDHCHPSCALCPEIAYFRKLRPKPIQIDDTWDGLMHSISFSFKRNGAIVLRFMMKRRARYFRPVQGLSVILVLTIPQTATAPHLVLANPESRSSVPNLSLRIVKVRTQIVCRGVNRNGLPIENFIFTLPAPYCPRCMQNFQESLEGSYEYPVKAKVYLEDDNLTPNPSDLELCRTMVTGTTAADWCKFSVQDIKLFVIAQHTG